MSNKKKLHLIRGCLCLSLLAGLLVLYQLASVTSGAAWLFGMSMMGMLLSVPVTLVCIALGWLLFRSWRDARWAVRMVGVVDALVERERVYWPVLFLSGAGLFLALLFLQVASRVTDLQLQAYLSRLGPYAAWLAFLCALTIFALRGFRCGADMQAFRPYRGTFLAALAALAVLLLLTGLVLNTGLGLTPDPAMWGDPGVPILQTQVMASLALTIATYGLAVLAFHLVQKLSRRELRIPAWAVDLLFFLLIWMVAVWHWNAVPGNPNYFAPAPVPPNYEVYPYSDATTYELGAQNLLIGVDPNLELVRPVYSLFLAAAQALSGIGYRSMLQWQVVVLALIPALLYLLGRAVHHRMSGVIVALLIIFQQSNAIALSGVVNVSHVNLLMSDLPTALVMVAFSLAGVFWLRKQDSRRVFAVLAAGILALGMLIRLQSFAVLLAVLGIVFLYAVKSDRKYWISGGIAFVVSLVLILTPWMYRNWRVTGQIGFSEVGSGSHAQAEVLGQRYTLEPDKQAGARFEGETQDEFLNRMVGGAVDFALSHPRETLEFMLVHFIHNQVSTILVLPARFDLSENLHDFISRLPYWSSKPLKLWERCCSLSSYVEELPYWDFWGGAVQHTSFIPLAVSLIFIAIGLGASWGRLGLAGLLPLFVNFAYTLSNAAARNSGWRFNLPVDWVGLFYYGIGIIQVCFWVAVFFSNRMVPRDFVGTTKARDIRLERRPFPWRQALWIGAVFFAVIAAIPLAEWAVPYHYEELSPQVVLRNLEEQELLETIVVDTGFIDNFMNQDGAVAVTGRGLYPRFFRAGEGLPGTGWAGLAPMDYDRLTFYVTSSDPYQVVLPLSASPDSFPHASDVVVIGCQRDGYLEAKLVAIFGGQKPVIIRSPGSKWSCAVVK